MRHVLDDNPARRDLLDDAEVLEDEPAPVAREPGALASGAEVLAGEASAKHIDGREVVSADGADVVEALGVGPVSGEDVTTEGGALDLPDDGAEPGPLEAKLEAADAGEKRADGEGQQPSSADRSTSIRFARPHPAKNRSPVA